MLARGIFIGIVLTLALAALAAYVAVIDGWLPAGADGQPGKLETWAAKTSLHVTLRREAPKTDNPVAGTDANLESGIKLYAANCIVCHGAADKRPSNIALGLYQNAPHSRATASRTILRASRFGRSSTASGLRACRAIRKR